MGDERYALGVEIKPGMDAIGEIRLMERMTERMYADALELRNCGKHLAASALENAAFGMVGEVNRYRDWARAEIAKADSP